MLLLTCPNTSLFQKKAFVDMSLGTALLAGGMKSKGRKLDHLDLNMVLNRRAAINALDEHSIAVLTDKDFLYQAILNYEALPRNLTQALEICLQETPFEDYKYIGFSIDRIGYESSICKASYHFALLLANRLKTISNNEHVFILGGRQALEQIGQPYVQTTKVLLKEHFPFHLIFYKDAHSTLAETLQLLDDGAQINSESIFQTVNKKSFFSDLKKSIPEYRLINDSDRFVSKEQIFPPELLSEFKELNDIEPIFIAPYKFSLGCPFRCSFCTDGLNDHYSDFGAQQIVENLKTMEERGEKYFRFFNNNINVNLKFVNEFHKAVIDNDLKILFSDSANFRIFNEDIVKKISDSGCIKLWYGAETTSEHMQGIINKRISIKRISSYLEIANRHDIWNSLNFIYNFPHETEEDFESLTSFMANRELVNTFYRNEFMLLSDTDYAQNTDKYRITIQNIADNGLLATYDEIDGLNWGDKQQLGIKKLQIIDRILPFSENIILSNDQLIFSLRTIYNDKEKVKLVVNRLIEFLRKTGQIDDYAYQRTWRLPEEVYNNISGSSSVFRNEMQSNNKRFYSKRMGKWL